MEIETRLPIKEMQDTIAAIRTEIGKVIIGQEKMIDLMIIGLLCDGHMLIEGVPGLGKTLSARLLARTIHAGFSRIQFTPDLMPSDVTGTSVFNSKAGDFEFKPGPIFSSIILIDEINRAPAKTQASLFEVMEERQVTVDGKTYKMEDPFLVLATQNPIEQEGTYRLPEAQLDRFLFLIEVEYPKLDEEYNIIKHHHERRELPAIEEVQPVLEKERLAAMRDIARQVIVEDKLLHYIAQVVHHTRNHPSLYLGASPRASIAILKSSKALAAMQGRDYVIPEDIKFVMPYVMKHRMILSPEKEMEGYTLTEVVQSVIQSVEIPR